MSNAIMAAATEYASLIGSMSTMQVLQEMQAGNKSIIRSVLMLMEVAA